MTAQTMGKALSELILRHKQPKFSRRISGCTRIDLLPCDWSLLASADYGSLHIEEKLYMLTYCGTRDCSS